MAEETITRAELAAWFRRFHYGDDEGELGVKVGERAADNAFADILSHREPEYEPGGIYEDAAGNKWQYDPACEIPREGSWRDCPWLRPGISGPASWVTPSRPLRKLVPESGLESRLRKLIAEMRGHPLAAATAVRNTVMADELEALLEEAGDEH